MHARFLHESRLWLLALLATAAPAPLAAQAAAARAPALAESGYALPAPERIRATRDYIKKTWTTLRRSARDLPAAAQDPKLHLPPGSRWPVYVPAAENETAITAALRADLGAGGLRTIELRRLPADTRELRVEKYDVVRGASDVAGDIRFGYAENQAGFGWTNGVYLELLAGLEAPSEPRRR